MASDEDNGKRAHFAIIAFPFASHTPALFTFARAAAAAAPAALVSFFTTAASTSSLPLPQPWLPNLQVRHVDDGTPPGAGAELGIEQRIGMFVSATPGNFFAAMEAAEEGGGRGARVTCVAADAFLSPMVSVAAEQIGVPWVAVWTCGTVGLLAHLYTDELRRTVAGANQQANLAESEETIASIPSLSAMRVRDLPPGIISGDLNSPVNVLLHRMAKRLPDASAVIINTFQGLDPAVDADFASKFKNYLPAGPLNLLAPFPPPPARDADQCLSWLDRQMARSVVYVSFSTAMGPLPEEIAEVAKGLESVGTPFLWSLKEGAQESLPAGFRERTRGRGQVVSWAPQVQVLEHEAVGAFLNHGGWNSVMESVAAGVPMVVTPRFAEQRSNARLVSAMWGVGTTVDGETATGVEMARALNEVMRGEEGKRMRERVGEIKERAIRAVADGGSSRENLKRVMEILLGVD